MFDINSPTDRVMVSLEQHDIKPGRQELGIQLNNIGFQIMKVREREREREKEREREREKKLP